jgi:hypothetical protein
MYYKLICILYALLCGQNFIPVKSGCYSHGAAHTKGEEAAASRRFERSSRQMEA